LTQGYKLEMNGLVRGIYKISNGEKGFSEIGRSGNRELLSSDQTQKTVVGPEKDCGRGIISLLYFREHRFNYAGDHSAKNVWGG
jgi:hypothetical protein